MAQPEASKKKRCFVVGPIGPDGSDIRTHADWLFEGIIKPAFDGFADFEKPIRADMIAQPGMITTQVIEHLLEDDLVIADLSLANPNAFYEIGIRHMVQKPIVHMQKKDEPTPFDTSGFRAIKFTVRHPADLVEARRDLAAAIKVAIAPDHRVENPVTHARGAIQLEQTATPEQKVILAEIAALQERMGALEMGRIKRSPPASLGWTEEFYVTLPPGASFADVEYNLGTFLELRGYSWEAKQRPDGTLLLRVSGQQAFDRQYKELVDALKLNPFIKSLQPVL